MSGPYQCLQQEGHDPPHTYATEPAVPGVGDRVRILDLGFVPEDVRGVIGVVTKTSYKSVEVDAPSFTVWLHVAAVSLAEPRPTQAVPDRDDWARATEVADYVRMGPGSQDIRDRVHRLLGEAREEGKIEADKLCARCDAEVMGPCPIKPVTDFKARAKSFMSGYIRREEPRYLYQSDQDEMESMLSQAFAEGRACTDYPVSELYSAAEAMAIYGFIGGWRCRICMVATEGDENNAGYAPKPFPHHSSCVLHRDLRAETAAPGETMNTKERGSE